MRLFQRFPLLLFQPDYATSDLYDSPPMIDAFVVVSAYAVLSALKPFIEVVVAFGSIKFALFTFMGTAALIYLTWVCLTLFFHFVSDVLGATGELHNAVSFVGLAAAPNVVIAVISLLILIVKLIFFSEQTPEVLSYGDFALSLIGMAWGWPGMLCYFGLKNAERLGSIKALLVVMPVFFGFAMLEVMTSTLFAV